VVWWVSRLPPLSCILWEKWPILSPTVKRVVGRAHSQPNSETGVRGMKLGYRPTVKRVVRGMRLGYRPTVKRVVGHEAGYTTNSETGNREALGSLLAENTVKRGSREPPSGE